MVASSLENKEVYSTLHDAIIAKRFSSPYALRKYAHHQQYKRIVDEVPAGSSVLDAGCGEGVLSVLLAKKGCIVTGVDLSQPNVEAAALFAEAEGVKPSVQFLVGDAENLPVADKSFDYVVSSHVLEHLPDFIQGVRELNRVARVGVIVAIPTCLNLCSWVQLGGDKYWTFSRRTPYALFLGAIRVFVAWVKQMEGVNETYAGHAELIHIFRFPWVGVRKLQQGGLRVERYAASSLSVPYIPFILPLVRMLESCVWWRFFRNFGYGTTYVCTPQVNPVD